MLFMKKRGTRKISISAKTQDYITPQYRYIKELALLKYDAEEKREQNLIQQSSQMQTVFSFMTAAVFMATPICIEYRGVLSLKFFFVTVSLITVFIIASLVLASLAQWRWKTKAFPDIKTIKDAVINSNEWKKMCVEYYQIDQWLKLMATVQEEKARLNARRVKLIIASMICFYVTVAAVVACFVVAVIKMI